MICPWKWSEVSWWFFLTTNYIIQKVQKCVKCSTKSANTFPPACCIEINQCVFFKGVSFYSVLLYMIFGNRGMAQIWSEKIPHQIQMMGQLCQRSFSFAGLFHEKSWGVYLQLKHHLFICITQSQAPNFPNSFFQKLITQTELKYKQGNGFK